MTATTMIGMGSISHELGPLPSISGRAVTSSRSGVQALQSNQNIAVLKGFRLQQSKQQSRNRKGRNMVVRASTSGGKDLYQPFRPPPSPVFSSPALGSQTIEEQLEILKERQGLWFSYATILPSLARAGYSPSEIDEATGLTGHEQNQLVVGAQVRDSLVVQGLDPKLLSWFDVGGEERLYELRTLAVRERKAAAEFVVERNMDAKLVNDMTKSMKDFPRRKRTEGFEYFSYTPGDCLAFALYRDSKETNDELEIQQILTKALEFAVTSKAQAKIKRALGQADEDDETMAVDYIARVKVPVLRLSSKIPFMFPLVGFSSAQEFEEAPSLPALAPGSSGNFNVMTTSAPWNSWIAIPNWKPLGQAVAPVAVLVPDSTVLPKQLGITLTKDPILLIVDKEDTELNYENYFLLATEGGGLVLKLGSKVGGDQTVLGKVLVALKPPRPEDPNVDDDFD